MAANPCGGTTWRTRPDGVVLVGDDIAPWLLESDADLARTWQNLGGAITSAAAAELVPESWLLAIAHNETGYLSARPDAQNNVIGTSGEIGAFQVMPQTAMMHGAHSPDDLRNPELAALIAARVLAEAAHRYGWELPPCAASYNAGSVKCSPGRGTFGWVSTNDYPTRAVRGNNSAILELGVGRPQRSGVGAVAAAAAGLVFLGYAYLRTRRRAA